jgi:hypothetical protein
MSATILQIQSLFENSLWRRRRYWTECARPRAQQGWKDGGRRFFEYAGNAHIAAPGTGAFLRRTFQTGFQFNAETQRTRRSAERWSYNQAFLDCGGNPESFRGTPLWKLSPQPKSGVAAALQSSLRFASAGCHRSPKFSFREPLRSPRLCVSEANLFPNRP